MAPSFPPTLLAMLDAAQELQRDDLIAERELRAAMAGGWDDARCRAALAEAVARQAPSRR